MNLSKYGKICNRYEHKLTKCKCGYTPVLDNRRVGMFIKWRAECLFCDRFTKEHISVKKCLKDWNTNKVM